jgi:uncharacterized protein DUF3618
MTASEQAGEPSGGDAAATASDPQALEREIERTREQLGETVEQLVAKTDVKARAQAKITELTGRVKAKAGHMQRQAAGRTGGVSGQRGVVLAAAAASGLAGVYLLIKWWQSG